MKKSKLESVKKNRKRLLFTNIFTIVCLVFLGLIYLTSNTEAQFTSTRVHKQMISAGEWWDGSSLIFNRIDRKIIESCEPVTLAVEIKNDSKYAMYGTSEYEVYNASLKEGGLLEIGDRVSDGALEIAIIESGETLELTHIVSTPGDYVFKAYQRPKYDDNEVERASIISDLLTVTCFEKEEVIGEERNESVSQKSQEIEIDKEYEESDEALEENEHPEKGEDELEKSKQDTTSSEKLVPNPNEGDKEEEAEGDEKDE